MVSRPAPAQLGRCLCRRPRSNFRITTGEHAAEAVLWPALAKLLSKYPDIKVELIIDYGLTDIVAERYDAGFRLGEQIAKDMIAVRIGPDIRMPAQAEVLPEHSTTHSPARRQRGTEATTADTSRAVRYC